MSSELAMVNDPLALYNKAKHALIECDTIDQCREIKNRAEAIKAYSVQARDDELKKIAQRIQLRAIKRMGDLLLEIPSGEGLNQNIHTGSGMDVSETRTSVAEDAGLTKRQKDTAIKLGNIPNEEFEVMVESPEPPTITSLMDKPKQPPRPPKPPTTFDAYISISSLMQALAESCKKYSPAMVRRVDHPLVAKSNAIPGTERDCLVVYNWIKEYLNE